MAKFKVLVDFHGKKENKTFKKGEEIELTVKRAEEIEKNIHTNFHKYKHIKILERLKGAD